MSSKSPKPPLTTWELVKMTGPIIFFGILLPTVDNLTDLRMIIRLYSGITGCTYVNPYDYVRDTNGTWKDLVTCQRNPDTNCKQWRGNTGRCDCHFDFSEYPSSALPGCRWDYYTCNSDPATFCEDNQHRLTCGGLYQHVKFATMFTVKG